jgi:hypothetical protein
VLNGIENGSGGGNRTRSLTAYEAAAFPLGYPAVFSENGKQWHGVPVLPRTRKVLEALLRCWRPPYSLLSWVRSAGLAPASPDWHSGILLLNDDRKNEAARLMLDARRRAAIDNKEQTPLPAL